MNFDFKVVTLNCDWVADRLEGIADWWKLPFNFQIQKLNNLVVPFRPWSEALATLDEFLLDRVQDPNVTTLVFAPWQTLVFDAKGRELTNRAPVRGLQIPRRNGRSTVIEVISNKDENAYVNGQNLGDACSLWANHELSHHFCFELGIPDRTHQWFYGGTPEEARDEILNAIDLPNPFEHVFLKDLKRGDTGNEVIKLQQALMLTGDLSFVPLLDRGHYGPLTQSGVFSFQLRKVKLTPDGLKRQGFNFGPSTRTALNKVFR